MSDYPDDPIRRNAFLESQRRDLFDSLPELDVIEIEQFCSYDGVCHLCHSPYYGILDESKLTLPMGGLTGYFRSRPSFAHGRSQHGIHVDHSYTTYEIRQNICRSGLYSRDQLSSVLRLNQHHLEVAEQAFRDIRPRRCECDFGESFTEDELLALALVEDPVTDTRLDRDFVAGKPVRTGFRRRSPDAILRRRKRAKKTWLKPVRRITVPVVHPIARGTPIGIVNDKPIHLEFEFLPPKSRQLRASKEHYKGKRPRNRDIFPEVQPNVGQKKYWYFKRKRGKCTLSKHHPLPDDYIHLRTSVMGKTNTYD